MNGLLLKDALDSGVHSANPSDRDWAQPANDTPRSGAVDLNQVTARLLQGTPPRCVSPRPQSPQSGGGYSSTLPGSPIENGERRSYNELVKAGGRPLYPVDLIDNVARDPGAYLETLRPWLDWPDAEPPRWSGLFMKQTYDWMDFRDWQRYNRSQGPPKIERVGARVMEYLVFSRHFRRKAPNYAEALRSLLLQYGFIRPFQLQNDPAHQDKLTTWIEYLGYGFGMLGERRGAMPIEESVQLSLDHPQVHERLGELRKPRVTTNSKQPRPRRKCASKRPRES